MARVTIKNLTKRFGNDVAVNGMNLEIADREFLVLLGPSGAGKTTTLRCVAGLEQPEAGEVYFDGQPMPGQPGPARRGVRLPVLRALPAQDGLPEHRLAAGSAAVCPRPRSTSKVREVAQQAAYRARCWSGGPRSYPAASSSAWRSAGRWCASPRVFLMDEPLTNLDFKLRVEMRTELKHLHADLATTFFYVTNDQVEACRWPTASPC